MTAVDRFGNSIPNPEPDAPEINYAVGEIKLPRIAATLTPVEPEPDPPPPEPALPLPPRHCLRLAFFVEWIDSSPSMVFLYAPPEIPLTVKHITISEDTCRSVLERNFPDTVNRIVRAGYVGFTHIALPFETWRGLGWRLLEKTPWTMEQDSTSS